MSGSTSWNLTLLVLLTLETLVASRPSFQFTTSSINLNDFRGLTWNDQGQMNVSVKRKIRLYSTKTLKYLQVKEKFVNGKAKEGSKYSQLVLESVGFGLIRIKGFITNRYICFNQINSKLITKENGDSKYCVFSELLSPATLRLYYTSFVEKGWYIALKNNGKPRAGNTWEKKSVTSIKNSTYEFIERSWTR